MTAWQMHKEAHRGVTKAVNCWYCDNIVPPIAPIFTPVPSGERKKLRGLWSHKEKLLIQRTNLDFYRDIMDKKEKEHRVNSELEAARRKASGK